MRILVPLLVCSSVLGCHSASSTGISSDMAMPTSLGAPPSLAMACSDLPADVYTLPTSLPAMDASHRGDVVRCSPSESLTADWANTQATAMGYPGPSLPSGFWTWRIAYRSLRASDAAAGSASEGDMAAVLAVPEKPLPGAPLVVYGHPTVGLAPSCATSYTNLADASNLNDYSASVIPLVAYGYTVIIPDYEGFAYGQPPGYFHAEDEAYGILDATRAARAVLPADRQFDKVVFVGHSQGGHAVIAAQHYASSYGMSGNLVGVAAYAPWWTSMAAFGAITSPLAMFNTNADSTAILFAMWYFYAEGELLDGPGMGLSMFQPSKRDLVRTTLVAGQSCYDATDLQMLGTTTSDFFDQSFIDNVGSNCAATPFNVDCSSPDATKWLARWKADRPPLDPMGAPLLVWYSGGDQDVTVGFAQCARDRFASDLADPSATATITYCFDPSSGHTSVPKMNADHVNHWIAARAGIGSEPSCAPFPTGQTCATPPNDY
ncbi:MAG TPA: alpha/beta fold hydrolase [Polyangia bacterium]|nr:alpha/beta fold hydrolase [Polyangia bacterium]